MTRILDVALVVVALAVLPAVYRICTGPRDADRAVAADVVFFAVIAVVALLGLRLGAGIALDVILVASVVGFLATMSLARLVTRGRR